MPSASVISGLATSRALCGRHDAVAHDDGVEHAILIEGKLVLAQNSELSGADNSSLLRPSSPVSRFMKVNFPAPFGPVKP